MNYKMEFNCDSEPKKETEVFNAAHSWKLLWIFTVCLFVTLGIFVASILAYFGFFLERAPLHPISLYALLNSPSTIAFQLLMMNLALLLAPFFVIWKYKLVIENVFSWRSSKLSNFLLATLLVLSSCILIDQFLFLLFDSLLGRFTMRNLAGNLNLASIIANLDQTDLFSYNLLLLLTIISGPALEELFFRGILWNGFRQSYSFKSTLLLTSFLFAVIHFDLLQGLSAFFMGLIYGYIIEKTKSIWCSILGHVASSYMTFLMSDFGLSYGLGGMSYPVEVLSCALIIWLVSFIIIQKTNGSHAIKSSLPPMPVTSDK
jgi:uncharacterized protein